VTGVELSRAIAVEVLKLTADPKGRWVRGDTSHTGWRVATERLHAPGLGFFRPDLSHWQLGVVAKILRPERCYEVRWRGEEARIFVDGACVRAVPEGLMNADVAAALLDWHRGRGR
jgi:hypothetical protein